MNSRPRAVVLSEGPTASTDYFLFPHLERLGYDVSLVDSRLGPGDALQSAGYRLVVIARYLSGEWSSAVEALRRGATIVYFMDDDLFDLQALRGLPWRYRWKIFTRSILRQRQLQRLCKEIWVSTAYLAEKYAALHPVLLHPRPSPRTVDSTKSIRVCYHGTESHRREIEWLMPIIEAVQARSNTIHFEIFGTHGVNRLFNRLPRVSVLHPMSWANYLSFTSTQTRDLALAPLLPGGFNAGRGPTKFFDYARMGAVGLYSNQAPYRGVINDGVDGVLLDNDPALWVNAVLELAVDHAKREHMAAEIRRRVRAMITDRQ